MVPVSFVKEGAKILCLGAHSDDIEIGCGGTVLRLLHEYPGLTFHWVIFSAIPVRKQEALNSADLFLQNAKEKQVVVKDFRDAFFPYQGTAIKEVMEELKHEISPDLIFTHHRMDLHQDHRLLSELTWNTFRNHMILEYEILKYDGDLGAPGLFVHLEKEICRQKINYIVESFPDQRGKHWFSLENFESLLRIRGVESNAPSGFAEGFYCRKMVF